jgi:hypothetical protein
MLPLDKTNKIKPLHVTRFPVAEQCKAKQGTVKQSEAKQVRACISKQNNVSSKPWISNKKDPTRRKTLIVVASDSIYLELTIGAG